MNQWRKIEAPAVIIGGGIVGGAVAYYLARRGIRSVLLEKRIIGAEASGRNGGGVRAQCRNKLERGLAMASIKLWEGLEAELGFDIEYTQGGNIRMATTEERMAQLRTEAEAELADGLQVEVWDREELRRRAPYLSEMFIGAKYCPTDGVANPLLVPWAFVQAARRLGVTVMTHTEAVAIELHQGQIQAVLARQGRQELRIETPLLINAGGPWASQLSQAIGVSLPVEPARTFIGVTQPVRPFFTEFVSSHDLRLYCRPAQKGHVHIGAVGFRPQTFDQTVPADAISHLFRGAVMIPSLHPIHLLRSWAGTLAMTPDGLPVIGPVDGVEGYLLATGFSGHGFCLGPIVGQLLTEWIVEGEPSIPLDELSLARFG